MESHTKEGGENVKIHHSNEKPAENAQNGNSGTISSGTVKKSLFLIVSIILGVVVVGLAVAVGVIADKYKDEKDKNDKLKDQLKNGIKDEEYSNYTIEDNTNTALEMILTPKDGYDNVLLFLGGIGNVPGDFKILFENTKNNFVNKRFKIVIKSGGLRFCQFVKDYYGITDPIPAWFNVDSQGVVQDDLSTDNNAVYQSQQQIIKRLEELRKEVQDYNHLFLGGFSQGAIMTNNVMLNYEHELGGYLPFSGYPYDPNHLFKYLDPSSMTSGSAINGLLTSQQKDFVSSKANYHLFIGHSFNDDKVPYTLAIMFYEGFYKEYTNMEFVTVGKLTHTTEGFPMDLPRAWLEKRLKAINRN